MVQRKTKLQHARIPRSYTAWKTGQSRQKQCRERNWNRNVSHQIEILLKANA